MADTLASERSKGSLKESSYMEAPEDRGKIVYLVQFLYGMAILLPFNIIIACMDFYEDKVSEESIGQTMSQTFCYLLFSDARLVPIIDLPVRPAILIIFWLALFHDL